MRNGLVTLVLVVATAALLYVFFVGNDETPPIAYSGEDTAFLEQVQAGSVSEVLMRGEKLEVTFNYDYNADGQVDDKDIAESFVPIRSGRTFECLRAEDGRAGGAVGSSG